MAGDKELRKVTDEGEILSLLQGAKDNNLEVYIWRFVGAQKHLAQVRIESVRKIRNDFCITPGEGQDRAVQDLIGSQSQLDLYIPESAMLLRCNLKQTDAPFRYYLQFPSTAAQSERRKDFRLNVINNNEVKLSFGKTIKLPKPISQHFHKGCLDISTGGVSFFISKAESKMFGLTDEIKAIELKAGDWSTKVDARIVSVSEVEPDSYNGLSYKVWRVSCSFTQIDQISRKYLEKFIFERIKDELHAINK